MILSKLILNGFKINLNSVKIHFRIFINYIDNNNKFLYNKNIKFKVGNKKMVNINFEKLYKKYTI